MKKIKKCLFFFRIEQHAKFGFSSLSSYFVYTDTHRDWPKESIHTVFQATVLDENFNDNVCSHLKIDFIQKQKTTKNEEIIFPS